MRRLVKTQLDNVKKEIMTLLAIPLSLSLLSILTNLILSERISAVLFILTFFASFLVSGAIFLYTVLKDHWTFFGDGASFYSALPISPKEVLLSRYLYYLITGFISFIAIGLSQLISIAYLLFSNINHSSSFAQEIDTFFKTISNFFSQLPPTLYAIFFLLFIITYFSSIGHIIFATSYGSEKRLRRFGIGGPILAYIVTGILTGIFSLLMQFFLPLSIVLQGNPEKGFSLAFIPSSLFNLSNNLYGSTFVMSFGSVIVSLAFGIFYFYRSYISHRDKLSVY